MKLFAIITLCAATVFGQTAAKQKAPIPKVVFVCEHGAAKSVMAAAEFSRLAKKEGLLVEVVSRGTSPDPEIPSAIRNGLRENGLDIGSAKPVKISAKDLQGATRIVTFGPDLKEWMPTGGTAIDWSATPSPSKDFKTANAYIHEQVNALVTDLKKTELQPK